MQPESPTPELTAEFSERLNLFLAAARDPEAGGALYDLYAPEARLHEGGKVQARQDIAREAFISAHQQRVEKRQAAPAPDLQHVRFAHLSPTSTVGQALAWFVATESGGGLEVDLAVGFTRLTPDSDWLIDWCALAEAPGDWGYDLGKAHMLADFPYANGLLAPRTWLDLSYHRLYGLPTPPLLLLPEARFSCHFSTTCCTINFQIKLEASAQAFIDAVPWAQEHPPLVGTQLPVLEDGRLLLKAIDDRCRFLDEQNHCRIHRAMGRSVFGPCTVHPYSFAETPDGLAVSTSSLCSSARACLGAPLQANAKDIYARRAIGTVRHTEVYRLTSEHAVPWQTFRDAEAALLALMDRTDLPLYRRLWIGTRLIPAWAAGQHQPSPEWESEPIPPHEEEDRVALAGFLTLLPPWIYGGNPVAALARVSHAELREPELLTYQMKNMIHGKHHAFDHDLLTAHNVMIFLYVVTLTMQAPFRGQPLPESMRQMSGLMVDHSSVLDSLAAGILPELATISRLMRSPSYGRWVLGYPSQEAGECP